VCVEVCVCVGGGGGGGSRTVFCPETAEVRFLRSFLINRPTTKSQRPDGGTHAAAHLAERLVVEGV
jgi:hypothetical protein